MPGRNCHQEWVMPQRFRNELAIKFTHRDKSAVKQVGLQALDELRKRNFGQPDANLWSLLPGQCEQRGQSSAANVADHTDAQRAAKARRSSSCAGLCLLAGQHDAAGILQKDLSGPSQANTARGAMQQSDPQVCFELANGAR